MRYLANHISIYSHIVLDIGAFGGSKSWMVFTADSQRLWGQCSFCGAVSNIQSVSKSEEIQGLRGLNNAHDRAPENPYTRSLLNLIDKEVLLESKETKQYLVVSLSLEMCSVFKELRRRAIRKSGRGMHELKFGH